MSLTSERKISVLHLDLSNTQSTAPSTAVGQTQACQVNSGNFKRRARKEKFWILECGETEGQSNVLIAVEFGRTDPLFSDLSLSLSVFFAFRCIACEQKWVGRRRRNPNSDTARKHLKSSMK